MTHKKHGKHEDDREQADAPAEASGTDHAPEVAPQAARRRSGGIGGRLSEAEAEAADHLDGLAARLG